MLLSCFSYFCKLEQNEFFAFNKVMKIFSCLALFLCFSLFSQNTNTYLGPNEKLPGKQNQVRVQILLYNDPNPKGLHITKAEFAGSNIPLKPRDVYGYRGQASFQKPAGKYKLKWQVERDDFSWPRVINREEEVYLDDRDLWIQITITGDQAEIS